jgi:hypothetical protein
MCGMGGLHWISDNWVLELNALGIIGGLFFAAISYRSEAKTRRIANLLTITANRENIWKHFYARPELVRVVDPSADLARKPLTPAEEEFINSVILHINSAYYAMRDELVIQLEGLRWDVGAFMSLPLPRAVWEKTKNFQNADFIAFVAKCRTGGHLL